MSIRFIFGMIEMARYMYVDRSRFAENDLDYWTVD